jgi:uncharacterized protein
MKDGSALAAVKHVTRVIVGSEVRLRRAVARLRGRDRYRLAGACCRCAMCCETPAIQVDRLTWYLPTLRWLFLWWQFYVNGLEFLQADRRTRSFLFRCLHFDRENRGCDSYETRPFMCRDYPRELLSDAWPEFFPQCGFRPVVRDASARRAAIERSDLPPDKKAELMRRLYLE